MILEQIQQPNDVKKLEEDKLPVLAQEIREFLIQKVSETGGHLASNLGVVELTIALHRVLTFPQDKLIWDVGHQAYTHKILTGRKEGFDTLRKYGGMSGFPKRVESDCDCFDTGHSTTSLSAGLGMVKARDMLKKNYKVFAVIGDGSFTGGMSFEALNNAAELKTNYCMILNDNNMSIAPNVGGLSTYLGNIRTTEAYTDLKTGVTNALQKVPRVGSHMVDTIRKTKSSIKQLVIPGMLFENLGVTYLGPIDGHNIRQMERAFREASRVEGPVLVHVVTKKGKGYGPAEKYPDRFHGTGPYDIRTGILKDPKTKPDYTDVFGEALKNWAFSHRKTVAITAAMPSGTGVKAILEVGKDRLFDVGIAEQHAVTFAAGLAVGGLTPVVAIYSSFLQRAVDQMMHDVCMQKLHVVFAVDRAGLVGSDGETHQGCFDLSYLSMMPHMQVLAPMDRHDLEKMFVYAMESDGPVALRYPRGTALDGIHHAQPEIHEGEGEILRLGKGTAFLAVGSMVKTALDAAELLQEEDGDSVTVVNMRFVKPLDTGLIDNLLKDHDCVITLEDNVITGGFGEQTADYICRRREDVHIEHVAVPDSFITHGSVEQLRKLLGMDAESVAGRVRAYRGRQEKKA